jgi:hypothetical protein
MRTNALALALAATVSAAAAARAAEVNTAMLQSGNDDTVTYVCLVSNLGKTPITPTVELLGLDGVAFRSSALPLAPGTTFGIAEEGDASPSGRCRVSGAFSRSKVAVSFALRENIGRSLAVVTAP